MMGEVGHKQITESMFSFSNYNAKISAIVISPKFNEIETSRGNDKEGR